MSNKPFIVANVRDILDQYDREEISISRMTEMFNEVVFKWLPSDSDKGELERYSSQAFWAGYANGSLHLEKAMEVHNEWIETNVNPLPPAPKTITPKTYTMTEEIRKKIGATADRLYIINFRDTANKAENRARAAQKDSYINGSCFGYSIAEKELAEKDKLILGYENQVIMASSIIEEKDRIIAELNLALNEAEKKIKQLDTKPY